MAVTTPESEIAGGECVMDQAGTQTETDIVMGEPVYLEDLFAYDSEDIDRDEYDLDFEIADNLVGEPVDPEPEPQPKPETSNTAETPAPRVPVLGV